MYTFERMQTGDIANMVDRTIWFNELHAEAPTIAAEYWSFVIRGYTEQGYQAHEIIELMCEADEMIKNVNQEIEEMRYVR